MAMLDLTTPKTLEIKNSKTPKEFDCAGMRTGPYAVPDGEPAYLNTGVYVPMHLSNAQIFIKSGDSVKINVLTSDEAAHYVNVCADLGLEANFQ